MYCLSAQIKRQVIIRANSHDTQSAPIRAKLSVAAIRRNRVMLPDSGERIWASYRPEFLAKIRVLAIRPNHLLTSISGEQLRHAECPDSGEIICTGYPRESCDAARFGRTDVGQLAARISGENSFACFSRPTLRTDMASVHWAIRRNQEEERKKDHNKLAEAIQNMQFGRSLAS